MEIIIGGRRTGKTTKLIMQAAKTCSQIVCMDQRSALNTQFVIDILGLRGFLPHPITYHELLSSKLEGAERRNISIDDAQRFIQYVVNNLKIDAISIEKEDNE